MGGLNDSDLPVQGERGAGGAGGRGAGGRGPGGRGPGGAGGRAELELSCRRGLAGSCC
jgi:hypothetical protein